MPSREKPNKAIFRILEKDSKQTLDNLNKFFDALMNLRFEGKKNFSKNTADLRRLVSYFEKEVGDHMCDEEKVLFPFLRKHIPRLEPMICLLADEHRDFRNCLRDLHASLLVSKKANAGKSEVIYQINDRGIHLICLLRGHMSVETKALYYTAEAELRFGEKKQLIEQIKKRLSANKKELNP